jgi:hypothetical protein
MTTNDKRDVDRLERLTQLNPTAVFLATLALFLAVLVAPDVIGGVLILVLATGLALLLRKTWPVLPAAARWLRLTVIVLLVAVALTKLIA